MTASEPAARARRGPTRPAAPTTAAPSINLLRYIRFAPPLSVRESPVRRAGRRERGGRPPPGPGRPPPRLLGRDRLVWRGATLERLAETARLDDREQRVGFMEQADVVERVAVDQQDVGEVAGLDAA